MSDASISSVVTQSTLPKCPHGVYVGGSPGNRARYCGLCTADADAEPKVAGRFRTCERCNKSKLLAEFHSTKKGLSGSCKECRPVYRPSKGFRQPDQCRGCGALVAPPSKYCDPCSTPQASALREQQADRVKKEKVLLRTDRYGLGSLTLDNWLVKLVAMKWRCKFCGGELNESNVTCVRVIPVTQGGKNDIENCEPACWTCKNRASARARWKRHDTDA
jgi:hypothetical protein